MEGSKALFMTQQAIPIFGSSQVNEAINYVKMSGHMVTLKASSLASGKGVLIPELTDEAIARFERD